MLIFFGVSAWSHERVRIARNNASAYITKNGKTYKACSPLKTSNTGKLMYEGRNFYKILFDNGICAGKWAWVPKQDVVTSSGGRSGNTATEAETCVNCQKQQGGVTKLFQGLQGVINPPNGFVPLPGSAARSCSQFVNSSGQLGDYGRRTLAAIQKIDPSGLCFVGGGIPISTQVCPGYAGFNQATREKFWVYLFGSIAHDESTCNWRAQNMKDGDGGSDGLFQLEYANGKRGCKIPNRSACRPRPFCYPDQAHNTKELKFQFECSAAILKQINCSGKKGRVVGNGAVFWSKLRVSDGDISNMIKQFPGCW
ncbi:MAG: hypothetical protein KDD34_08390 [Bdellovibrionales bacterium]|nr:hypothetical protein [Bdellovibrionales bacterium]